jgi:hypothetical protein
MAERRRHPAQIAQRAGHSITMLLAVCTHCIDGQDDITSRQIEHTLQADSQAHCVTASGSANRLLCPDPVRHMSVISRPVERVTANCDDLCRRIERVADTDLVEASRRSA